MGIFNNLFLDKEIKAVLQILHEIEHEFENNLSFGIVREQAERIILKNKDKIKQIMVKENISPRRTAYSWINNVSGDMLESGQYHVYRGVLNIAGNELLKIFDISTDKLVEVGDMDKNHAEKQKTNIRSSIKSVG